MQKILPEKHKIHFYFSFITVNHKDTQKLWNIYHQAHWWHKCVKTCETFWWLLPCLDSYNCFFFFNFMPLITFASHQFPIKINIPFSFRRFRAKFPNSSLRKMNFCNICLLLSNFPIIIYWRDPIFSIVYSCLFCQRLGDHMHMGLSLGFLSCSISLYFCFYASTF